jgi:dihydrofolate reductase
MTLPLVLIAAVARNRVIGRDNGLAWRLSSDLKRFKALTMGRPLVMGRKKFESIGKALPGRETIVVTRRRAAHFAGAQVAYDLAAALAEAAIAARRMGASEIIIAGGGDMYSQTIASAARLHITEVGLTPAGDTLFPLIDPAIWRETLREKQVRSANDEADFSFVTYERR